MVVNLYAETRRLATLTGSRDLEALANAAAGADRATHQKALEAQRKLKELTGFGAHATRGAIAGRNSNGLPGIRTGAGVNGQGIVVKGATYDAQGNLVAPRYIAPLGHPSINLVDLEDQGVETHVSRFSAYTPFISEAGKRRIQAVANKILARAVSLSKGKLTYPILAEKNHPYGIGPYAPGFHVEQRNGKPVVVKYKRAGLGKLTRLRGVSNLAVINIHTGDLLNAWKVFLKWSQTGVEVVLANYAHYTHYLLGTKKMRAHGPFLTAVQLFIPELDRVWLEETRRAYAAWARQNGMKAAL